jgi:Arc/MetJ-type ribon-helix-helix transcriptional regulator
MKTMEVTVTDEQAEMIDQICAREGLPDWSDMLVAGASALQDQQDWEGDWDEDELRQEIMLGMEQADRGEGMDAFVFLEQLRQGMIEDQARLASR